MIEMINKVLIALLSVGVAGAPWSPQCRCLPHESCWPSQHQWSALNDTLDHRLVAVRPVASVCSPQELDIAACKDVTELWTNSIWRSSQPGAIQWENWEAWPERHQSCYIETAHNTTCGQGRISLYSTKVQNASHVQSVVLFAKKHNLRLVIKNTGHDFLGRSTAPESLQILTHGMKDIRLVDGFIPTGAPNNKNEGPVVQFAAGVQLEELYLAVGKVKRAVITGSSHTVGAAGGYIQAGGHSPFGAWKGMASDNALEFEVVTANGTLVIANSYQNTDLFWALRGGGGTFGVVTRVTIRTFPDVPVIAYNLNVTTSSDDPTFWSAWKEWHASIPSLNDAGGSGYYFTLPNVPLSANMSVSSLITLLMFPERTNTTEVEQLYLPLIFKLQNITGVAVKKMAIPFPSINATVFDLLLAGPRHDITGSTSMLASRLYSKDLLSSKDGPARLTKAWKSIGWAPGEAMEGHVVAGGAVGRNGDKIDSAVNPAWRKTATHLLLSKGWSANATLAKQKAIIKNMTEVQIPILRSVERENKMGAYMNEASGYEPGFQKSFWGKNYPRLYRIKQKWDPTGLFITRKGVGSEDWDDAGLCKTVRPCKMELDYMY